MTLSEKEKIAGFLNLSNDFLTSGYKNTHRPLCLQTENIESTQESDCLEKIAQDIKKCLNCNLGKTRKNAVPGEGVQNPLVLVIGEGPGADEDTQGRPFVGKAGQLLDKMLESINLSRNSNCFIANIVKCRPPDNRDPHPPETEACINFLHRQIAILNPKIILLVGSIAFQSLLNIKETVGKMRGKFINYDTGTKIIPALITYHPSALLHNENFKRPSWEDLKLLRSKIESLQN